MKSEEVSKELGLSYDELVKYLLDKYGPAKSDYFINEKCRSVSKAISRSSEGLFCHHIDEDKAIMLSDKDYAINNPFEYQKASRLVYCNILEHLILHIKIMEMPRNKDANALELPGVGGVRHHICPKINDYYNGYEFKAPYLKNAMEIIKDNYDDYINVLKHLLYVVEQKPEYYALLISAEKISRGSDGVIVEKIYNDLF